MAKNAQLAAHRMRIRHALKLVSPELSNSQLDKEARLQTKHKGWLQWLERHPTLDRAQKRVLIQNSKSLKLNRFIHRGPNAEVLNSAESIIEASENIPRFTPRAVYYCYEDYGITDKAAKPTMEVGIKARIKQKLKLRHNQWPQGKTLRSILSDYGIADSDSDSQSEGPEAERAESQVSDISTSDSVISVSDEDDDDDDDDENSESSSESTSNANSTAAVTDTPTTSTSPAQPTISTSTPTNASRNEQLLCLVRLITTNGDQFNELRMEQLLKMAGQSDVSIDD